MEMLPSSCCMGAAAHTQHRPRSSSTLSSATAPRTAIPVPTGRCGKVFVACSRRQVAWGTCAALRIIQPHQSRHQKCTRVASAQSHPSTPGQQEELLKLVALLPPSVRAVLEERDDLMDLLEVVMDLGRCPLARFPTGDVLLSETVVTAEDLEYATQQVGSFGSDNRAGIDCTLHRISAIRNRAGRIIGLTCRVGRSIPGSAALVEDIVLTGASILFLGRPGVGKTTAIREVSRLLADACRKRVVIVDTSNEIGGDGDIPHPGIGPARRMQVPDPEQQHRVMIEAVENHTPQVIVIDEISTEAECKAARTISQRGVQLVATAHGNELENVIKNPSLSDLVGGISNVTLGDETAKKRGSQKTILERAAPPCFDVAVEMLSRSRWIIHRNIADAVDSLLAGGTPAALVRERAEDGSVAELGTTDQERASSSFTASSSAPTSTSLSPAELAELEAELAAVGKRKSASQNGFLRSGAEEAVWKQRMEEVARKMARDEAAKQQQDEARRKTAVLKVHLYGLERDMLEDVLMGMDLYDQVFLTDSLADADAVLALRSKLKHNAGLRAEAKVGGVPIYAVRGTSMSQLVKAFRTLLGQEPSAGGTWQRSMDGDEGDSAEAEAPAMSPPGFRETLQRSTTAAETRREAHEREEALEETRMAAEQIVMPLRQPVELVPRQAAIVEQQILLLQRYGLPYELAGDSTSGDQRIRVLPAVVAAKPPASGGTVDESSRGAGQGEGAVQLQWEDAELSEDGDDQEVVQRRGSASMRRSGEAVTGTGHHR